MKQIIYKILLLFLSIQIGYSQDIDTQKLDSYFTALGANNKFMGSVALLRGETIIYTKQTGFSDIETKKVPNNNTKYRIGSISKTFTATLIFKAIEEDKIELQQTIQIYFPTIKNAKKITISNLLNHRSGIHNFTNDEEYLEYHTQPKSKEEMIHLISKKESDFNPNSKAQYSNSNYVLLSYILESIYKKSYATILNEKIISPLQLKNTHFGGIINLNNNECYSYKFTGNWKKEPETHTSIPMGAGGIVSTPSDLLLFSKALFSNTIISEESVTQMKSIKDNHGMGLFQYPFNDKVSYGHTGGIDGFNSMLGYFPKEKIALAITSNGSNYNINNIAITLLKGVFTGTFEIPSFKAYKVTSKDLDKYLGIYSSSTFPLKITITKSDKTLVAQATGQSSFNLDAIDKDEFEFNQAGIVLEFNPTKEKMILKQGGKTFTLNKE